MLKISHWGYSTGEVIYELSAQLNMGSLLFKGKSIKNEGKTHWFMSNDLSNCYDKYFSNISNKNKTNLY